MLEVNNFNAVRITLASPEQIRSWSRGEVTKPETINYRTLKPERDGLFCERIFGPQKDWECACGKYKRVRYKGIVCDKCGVEVTRAKVRRERMGHIELASPVSHICLVRGPPSRIGLLLDMTPRTLEQILYFAKYVVIDVHETQRARLVSAINQDLEAKISRQERANQEKIEELTGDLNAELQRLETEKTERLQPLEGRKEQAAAEAAERSKQIEQQLESLAGTVIEEDITFEPSQTPIVRAGERVGPEARRALTEAGKEYFDRLETDTTAEQEKLAAEYDAQIDKLRYEIQEKAQKIVSESGGDESLKSSAAERIKRLESIKPRDTLSEMEFRDLQDTAGRMFRAGMGAEAIRDLLRNISLDELSAQLRLETHSTSGQKRKKATKRLRVVESFRKSGNRPEWMIMTTLPVLPPDLRPMGQLDGGRFATSDLNDLYRRVINRNNRLKRLLELQAPEIIIRNEKRMLQEAVDSLIDNGRRGRPVSGSSNHKLKSLSDMLKGKQGRFRQNLLGKRVDYSGRSVIVAGPSLRLHQAGLPKLMALELFKPFIMARLVERKSAQNIKAAKKMVDSMIPEVWDVLEEVIHEHPVLLNRAPTLHRLGIQAFEPVLVEGKAIQVHPLVCHAFNADFDGDQMAVHLPLSAEAQAEARILMLSSNNILSPAHGAPLATPTQDMILGAYYLTYGPDAEELAKIDRATHEPRPHVFRHAQEAELSDEGRVVTLHDIAEFRPYGREGGHVLTTIGRIIYNDRIERALAEALGDDFDASKYSFVNQSMKKRDTTRLIDMLVQTYGATTVSLVLDAFKDLGFKYATQAGITISKNDVVVPPEKQEILDKYDKLVGDITSQYDDGLITQEERHEAVVEQWNAATDEVAEAMIQNLDTLNPIFMMANSGARGSFKQIRQLAGMRGLMANPKGEIIERPIKANFMEGLSVLEYFISTHGARKGLADTALRTADSGYLTRRLVDVSQDVIIRELDCKSKDFVELPLFLPEGLNKSVAARILGADVYKPLASGKPGKTLIAERGEEVTVPRLREIVEELGEYAQDFVMPVRSVLKCKAEIGVCQACYGTFLATGEMCEIGDAVGIIAAQSIGEPGTQLTMRTFHTGGTAGADITHGLPRVVEIFEARNPKGAAELAEIDGTVALEETDRQIKITIVADSWNEEDDKSYTVSRRTRLLVVHGQKVEAGDALTEGSISPADLLRLKGYTAIELYLVDQVQKVYKSQGVEIHDKHIELIVRQMLKKVRVDNAGGTDLLPGQLVDKLVLDRENKKIKKLKSKEQATWEPLILGITKASLATESFLSAASFQETTKVLTDAAIEGKVDRLLGLKENVIIGKLIPAATGLKRYRQINIRPSDKVPVSAYTRPATEEQLLAALEEIDSH